METRAHHLLIGVFTLVVAIAALIFMLWLGKANLRNKAVTYDIIFQEPVSGLSKGSSVEFNGIKIGSVINLKLDLQDPRKVVARISVDADIPVKTDTKASLIMTSITGVSVIRLTSGSNPKSTALVAEDGEIPSIIATPSPLSKIFADGDDLVLGINSIITQSQKLLSDENIKNIKLTLGHLEKTTGAISSERENIKDIIKSSKQTTASLERTMKTIDTIISNNSAQINSGMSGLSNIGPAITDLRDTLKSLKSITQKLEDSPADFIFQGDSPKEFKP
jgi:phospholipid/cholesterol/gamma-HCH transport system substrate-binding protein